MRITNRVLLPLLCLPSFLVLRSVPPKHRLEIVTTQVSSAVVTQLNVQTVPDATVQPMRAPLSESKMSGVTGDGWLEAIIGAIIGMIEGGPAGAILGFIVGLEADWVCVTYADGNQDCYFP